MPVHLELQNVPGRLLLIGGHDELLVPKQDLAQTSVLIQLRPEVVKTGRVALRIGVFAQTRLLETLDTVFIGPRP